MAGYYIIDVVSERYMIVKKTEIWFVYQILNFAMIEIKSNVTIISFYFRNKNRRLSVNVAIANEELLLVGKLGLLLC